MVITVAYCPSREGWTEQYQITPDVPGLRCAIQAIACWSSLEGLSEFAVARHGYGNDSGGITYPGDLDDYDRACGS